MLCKSGRRGLVPGGPEPGIAAGVVTGPVKSYTGASNNTWMKEKGFSTAMAPDIM